MDANLRPDDDDSEDQDEEELDRPTSVTHVPEALLRSLKNPERAAPTVRPPPPAPPPVAAAPAPPPEAAQEDIDESATLVSSKIAMLTSPKAKPPIPRPAPLPSLAKPTSGTERRIERFHEETEDSPDEDPSDTGLATEIPEQVIRHLSQRPPAFNMTDDPLPPPPGAPMFEAPTAEMYNPPPPEHRTDPPPPRIVPKRNLSPALVTTLPSARLKKKKNVWMFVALGAALVLIASLSWTAYLVLAR